MRPLIIDEESKLRVDRVLEHARKRENWYLVGPGARVASPPPGDDPRQRYTAKFSVGFCAVFTFTKSPEGLFRHLTISVDGPKYPSVEATWMIAREFGFTGPAPTEEPHGDGSTWMFDVNKRDHCITVVQPVREEDV